MSSTVPPLGELVQKLESLNEGWAFDLSSHITCLVSDHAELAAAVVDFVDANEVSNETTSLEVAKAKAEFRRDATATLRLLAARLREREGK